LVFESNGGVTNATGAFGAALASNVNDYQTFLNAGSSKALGTLSWFEFGGNTFIVQAHGDNTFTAGSDSVTELVGLHNLANSTVISGPQGGLIVDGTFSIL
jgi:hypothetical protein